MIILDNSRRETKKKFPRISNTPERRALATDKERVNMRFLGKVMLMEKWAYKIEDKKIAERIQLYLKLMKDDFIAIRKVEAKLHMYDEMQRLHMISQKNKGKKHDKA